MNRAEVDAFEKLVGQLSSLYEEMSVLARKKPDSPVNAFKIGLVNTTLAQANSQLGATYRPYADFSQLNVDDLPSASDATFILAQYLECAEKLRIDNLILDGGRWYWRIDGEINPTIRAAIPKKLSEKR